MHTRTHEMQNIRAHADEIFSSLYIGANLSLCDGTAKAREIPENRRFGLALTADCTAERTTCARGRLTDAAFATGSHRAIHFPAITILHTGWRHISSNLERLVK